MNGFDRREKTIPEEHPGGSGCFAAQSITRGERKALLCLPEGALREKIVLILEETGYHLAVASAPAEAIQAMKLNFYDLVLLSEDHPLSGSAGHEALEYIESLPGKIRRRMLVGLLSVRYATGDQMAAFSKSVDIMIHQGNIDDIGAVLKLAHEEKESLYHLFVEASVKYGLS